MLDPARARAEADAAERRGAGTLWGSGQGEWDAVSVGAVEQPEVVPVVESADSRQRYVMDVHGHLRTHTVVPVR